MRMSDRVKKIIFIIVFIGITIFLGWLLYTFFINRPAVTPAPTGEAPIGGLPTAGTGTGREPTVSVGGQLIPAGEVTTTTPPTTVSPTAQGGRTAVSLLTNQPGSGATISADGSTLVYYQPSDGKFYRVTADGTATALSDQVFHNVETINWSSKKDKAILEYPDGANILYNFTTGKQITLPKHWEQFSFAPNNDQIAFKSMPLDPENRWLAVAKDDGSNIKLIEPLGKEEGAVANIDWSPNNQIIATYSKSEDLERTSLYFLGLNGENFRSTLVEGRDVRPVWSPKGDLIAYSAYASLSDLKPNMWVVVGRPDSLGSNRRNLELNTWADKCTFADNTTLYCAVPQYLPRGAGIVPAVADTIPDDFYRVDLNSGSKTLLAVPDGSYVADNLIVSGDGRYLYFTERLTGRLAKINLK